MAEIFRGKAVAAGGFEKPVAIKRIRPHLSQDRRFVELLIAEAKVLSLLKHRNIVQIFDVGLGDDGKYFLVMEFVDGTDIGAVQRALEMQHRRIPFDLVLHIGAEICEALEHAHTARAPDGKQMALVHRDVSPSNVLLSRAGEVKLTDFGIAKRAEQDVTHGGAVRGKFAYISPEQARNEHVDPRGDVFSVGILLWELVCNRRLFSGLDDLSALRAVREAQVPRPTEVDPHLPPEIDAVIMTALARDKARRYASAGAFGAKLRSLRYSLDETVGDPASELAKIVDATEAATRESRQMIAVPPPPGEPDALGEATVIRIRTADAFSARDNDASVLMARAVIDKFEEEEETRLAQLSGDQLRVLRSARRDSNEMTATAAPLARSRRGSDEATRARPPLPVDQLFGPTGETPPGEFLADEETRLLTPRDRRTPAPQRTVPQPAPAAPPPLGPPSMAPPGVAPPGFAPPGIAPPTMMPPPGTTATPPRPVQVVVAGAPPFGPAAPPAFPAWNAPIAAQRPPRDATPTALDSFDRPVYPPAPPQRPSMPQVAGFDQPRSTGLRPWMLVLGALAMAVLAFVITRLFIR